MTTFSRRGRSLVLSLSIALAGGVAFALAPSMAEAQDKTAVAQRLFTEGRARLKAQDYERACALLAESAELDAKVGTLASLGQCEEGRGLLANAWVAWQKAVYAAQASNDRRLEAVKSDFQRVDERVPKLLINASSPPPELRVIIDGDISLSAASLGIPFPVNVGSHTLQATAPGKQPWSAQVDASIERQQISVNVPRLADRVQGESVAPETAVVATPAPVEVGRPARTGSSSPLRPLGVTLGIFGLVTLGGASYAWWGYAIPHNRASYSDGCVGDVCTGQGKADRENAVTAGNIATGLVIGGAALVATGVLLWVVAPRASSRSPSARVQAVPWMDAHEGGLLATGTF
jgi:hypothetical protein